MFTEDKHNKKNGGCETSALYINKVNFLGLTVKSIDNLDMYEDFLDGEDRQVDRFGLLRGVKKILPGERMVGCHTLLGYGSDHVKIEAGDGRVFFRGLARCSSVWGCPVCAARISVERREEIRAAMKAHDGPVWLLTLTMRHRFGELLDSMLSAFKKAVMRFKQDRQWRNLPCVGSISATETTYGENGWHPHEHILLFMEPGVDESLPFASMNASFRDVCMFGLSDAWKRALARYDRECLDHVGLDLSDGSAATGYITKWGADAELTQTHQKRGCDGHFTPWDFLRVAVFSDDMNKKELCRSLFVEFYRAFKGRRQLTWSPGLKGRFGIVEKIDEEVDGEKVEGPEFSEVISFRAWRVIWGLWWLGALIRSAKLGDYAVTREIIQRAEMVARCLYDRGEVMGWGGEVFRELRALSG